MAAYAGQCTLGLAALKRLLRIDADEGDRLRRKDVAIKAAFVVRMAGALAAVDVSAGISARSARMEIRNCRIGLPPAS